MKHYLASIQKLKFNEDESVLQIKIDENIEQELRKNKIKNLEVVLSDQRTITPEQRKKAYATMRDIANWQGDVVEVIKSDFKSMLIELTGCKYFSLSDCSVSMAREYINLLIAFAIDWGVPLSDLAINRTDDIDSYLYYCLATRTCAISGTKNADIHHVIGSKVGMGGNRNKIDNRGRELIALSREWHRKVEAEGEEDIFKMYKIYGIVVDDETLKDLGLNVKEID